MTVLLLALGGAIGVLCRYHGARLIHARLQHSFPWGILLVNLSGSFLLGLVANRLAHNPGSSADTWVLVFGVGFCGAYTTFSSFVFDSVRLWHLGYPQLAVWNLAIQPLLGVLAAWCGLLLSK